MGFIGVCEVVVEASRLLYIRAWSAPALSVLLGMHTEVLSGVWYRSISSVNLCTASSL